MSSCTLAELQSKLQDYLLTQQNNIDGMTLETAAFTRQQRVAIYYDAYRLRLIDALRNDFPALELALGEEVFIQVMSEYIALHPSQHPSLRWMGEKLAVFLRNHTRWQQQPAIYELAEFEWAQITAFDAENATLASLDDLRRLQNTQWLELQLSFQPSLQLVNFYSNAANVWQALIQEQTRLDVTITTEAQHWLIWRAELNVVYRLLDTAEYECLHIFMRNENFAAACEGLCEWFPEEQVPLKAAQYLQQWLQNGLIAKIITAPV